MNYFENFSLKSMGMNLTLKFYYNLLLKILKLIYQIKKIN